MARSGGFFSPYSLNTPYWLILSGPDAVILAHYDGKPLYHNSELYGLLCNGGWAAQWQALTQSHRAELSHPSMAVAVLPADGTPSMQEIELSLRTMGEIDSVAQNLWLFDYLNDNRLHCFVQPVEDRNRKPVGYEAFARIEVPDGSIIGGGAIMHASRALHLEYQVDRAMQKQAVEEFVATGLTGMLFINFLTGFIHRPEVYLDGLSQAVERHQLAPRLVVLDVPLPAYAGNLAKLESIAAYCRTRGFSLALDDVTSARDLAAIVQVVRPSVVKLDPRLSAAVLDPQKRPALDDIIRIAHEAGAGVLAEGIENEASCRAYFEAGVDMVQGYHIGAPQRCEPTPRKKQKKA